MLHIAYNSVLPVIGKGVREIFLLSSSLLIGLRAHPECDLTSVHQVAVGKEIHCISFTVEFHLFDIAVHLCIIR